VSGPDFAAIYVNSSLPTEGSLFALAHELGHVLLESPTPLTDDHDFADAQPKERAANEFAEAFLAPAAELAAIIHEQGPGPAALALMMLRFGISWNVLLDRLHRLGYVEVDDRHWLAQLDRRALAESVRDPHLGTALLSQSGAPSGLHHAPRWITTRAWVGARRGAAPIEVYAALIREQPSGVALPGQTLADGEIRARLRTKGAPA
jgi:hypothetical protein